jgi:hypothetical protein
MRYYPRYHSRQVDAQGAALDAYVVIDATTNEPVTPPLPYHAANDYAGARNDPTQEQEPALYGGWAGIGALTASVTTGSGTARLTPTDPFIPVFLP